MKPEIENLKKLIAGDDLNGYQLQDATDEFYKLLKYVDDLEKLRQPLVSGMLPTDEEIINEAEGRYPVKTHNNPDNSPYVGTQKTFIHGVRWALAFVQGNYR